MVGFAKALEFVPANWVSHHEFLGVPVEPESAERVLYTGRSSAYLLSTPGPVQVAAVLLELAVLGS